MSKSDNLPPNLQNIDWYAIASKIRKKYEEIQKTVYNLEKSLLGYHKEIEKKDQIIEGKNKEIEQYKQQLNKLKAQRNNTDQQDFIEKLTSDLKESQIQRGSLERECSLLQENYNQQEYQLKEKDKENKELNIRLQRQQRITLEYKAILDKHLDSSSYPESNIINQSKGTIKSWSELNTIKSSNQENKVDTLWTSETEPKNSESMSQESLEQNNLALEKPYDNEICNSEDKNSLDIDLPNINEEQKITTETKMEEENIKKDIESSSEIKNGNRTNNNNSPKRFIIDFPNFDK